MAPCQISTFSDIFYILQKLGNEKVGFLWWFHTIILHISLVIFLAYGMPCEEEHKRDFSYPFSPLIYGPIGLIWITGIKCQENAVNPFNIANEPRKVPNFHSHDFMVYVEHRKKIICKQRRCLIELFLGLFQKFR